MRQIKFRGWNKDYKRMSKSFTIEEAFDMKKPYPTPKIVFMQYTGLKDKKGVEIFEGDIVKADVKTEIADFTIIWGTQGGFEMHSVKKNHGDHSDHVEFFPGQFTLEVIGNIYENKEVLK